MTGTRLDKWMWAARFFKTRTLAAKACELGRIEANHQPARSSREVRVGDLLSIKSDGGDFEVEVLGLSDVRGPAPIAQALYRETEASREARKKLQRSAKLVCTSRPLPPADPPNETAAASSASAATADSRVVRPGHSDIRFSAVGC
jgi:ribosome-associated heat shock protein Hsp15